MSSCEIFRFYKLITTKSLIEPVSMIVPRRVRLLGLSGREAGRPSWSRGPAPGSRREAFLAVSAASLTPRAGSPESQPSLLLSCCVTQATSLCPLGLGSLHSQGLAESGPTL